MIQLAVACLLLLVPSLHAAQGRQFTISGISNPENAEENERALNEEFAALWRDKVDISSATTPSSQATFVIQNLKNIQDPKVSEEIANAIQQNLDELWLFKLDVNDPPIGQRYYFSDLGNKDKSEENAFAINSALDDLWAAKVDK